MPLKNSNTVAVERRMDLASLFCMISRHGPAVALAVIAMVSVLAGFIIYRTVRGKRRKATADGDSGSPAAESQPSPEESHSSAESTDMRDEGPSDLKEDADLIQSDLKIRHRRAAAAAAVAPEKPSPPRSHPETDIQASDPEHTTSDDTGEREVVWNSHKAAETYSGEPLQGLSSDIYTAAEEVVVEDDVDCHQDATDDAVEDVMETVADHDSCLREPELINDENHDEEEKVLKEECQEAEDVTTDEDVSDMNTRQEEETFQHTLNNPVCFQQTSDMGEMGEDDMLQDNKTTLETNGLESKFEEPVVHDEDVPAPCICSGKDEQFEEGRPDSIDCSSYFGNNSLSPEAEEKNEGERAEEEFLVDSVVPQQPELLSSIDQDTGATSTEQDLSDHLMDKVMPPTGDSKLDEDDDLTTEVIEEVLDEDHVNTLTAIKIEDHSLRCSEKEVEIEQKQENGRGHEDGGLDDGVDQAKEKMLTSDDTVASSEESDSTTVALLCLGTPVNVDDHDDGLPSIAIDAKVQIAGVAHIPDLSLGCQPKSEDEIAPSLDDKSRYSTNNSLSPEEEKESEDKMPEGECVDSQQVEILSSTFEQETYLPSAKQDQSDHIMEKEMPPIGDSDVVADDGPAGELNKEVVNEDQLKKRTADTHSPQFDNQEVEIDQHKQDGLNQEDGVLDDGADQVKGKTLTCNNVVVDSEEGDSSDGTFPCLSMSIEADDHVNSLLGISNDANAQISGIADSCDMSLDCQPQSDDKILPSLDEDTDFTVLALETENLTEENKNDQTVLLAEECKGQVHDPESVQMINDEVFDKASVAANPDPFEYLTASAVVEEIPCPYPPFICQDEKNDCKENDGTLDTMRIDSATDAVHCNDMNHTALSISEEICHPDILSSSQDQQIDHMENNEVATSAAPIMTKDISLPMCQIYLPSLEQSKQKHSEILSPSVGAESGISSMAVSPDLQDAGNGFDVTVQNMVLPVMDYDLKLDGQTRAHNSLYTDDAAVSVTYKNTAGMVFGPYPSYSSQKPHNESTDWTKYESFAANEDMFGHEIEDSYHRAMDQYAAQIAVSVASYVDDLKIQREIKIEAVEIKEKKAGVSTKKKEDPNAEEKEEDNDRTEISIMEATMDNNEWITESNFQVLPWMNLSTPSLAQDDTKTNQLPTEDSQQSSTTCTDMTDIQTSAEVKQTTTLSDENMDTNKKVVAVQPMPQNVNVTFRVHYFTQSPYQTVAVTGNQPELGSWKGFIPLERGKDGHWATVVSLPAESHVEWKFVLLDKGEVCRWEECGNRLLDTGFGDDLLVHKWWGLM